MFETLKNVFRVKEMRRKLLYLIWMIFIIRIGCQIPVPGVDSSFFKQWFSSNAGDAFNFFDAFTGGSFERMSIFALNITPYITSSIIIQLLTIAIPALEEMQRDGEEGRKKMTAITRYVTVGLALFESVAMAIGFGRQGMIPESELLQRCSSSCLPYSRFCYADVARRTYYRKGRWKRYFYRTYCKHHLQNAKRLVITV